MVLHKNNLAKTKKIHRLVAETFISNKENKPQVNHIDGNKQNNSVSNLEWCTNRENQLHAWKKGLQTPKYYSENKHAKKVNQYDLLGNFIKEWDCIKEAAEHLKIQAGNISACCKNKRNKAGNFIWKYIEEETR